MQKLSTTVINIYFSTKISNIILKHLNNSQETNIDYVQK